MTVNHLMIAAYMIIVKTILDVSMTIAVNMKVMIADRMRALIAVLTTIVGRPATLMDAHTRVAILTAHALKTANEAMITVVARIRSITAIKGRLIEMHPLKGNPITKIIMQQCVTVMMTSGLLHQHILSV